ncbi:MAG TPA: response regulator transcription factor [Acidimicrobiales bacterium]|nr:response regulator transcription factor [Acidimicrobiales bacterium]
MHATRVLAIEDDEVCRRTLLSDLTEEGFLVDLANTGSEGLLRFRSAPPDVVLVRSPLPDMHGTEVCRRLQQTGIPVPIIVLSETLSEDEVVRALESGATDVTKPSELAELKARMKAVLRRTTTRPQQTARVGDSDQVTVGPFTVDLARQEFTAHGRRVGLTGREAQLLALLLSPANRVRTRAELADEIWPGRKGMNGRALDAHIRRLRLKIDDGSPQNRHIVTVHGVGFLFDPGKLESAESTRSVIEGLRRRMPGGRRRGSTPTAGRGLLHRLGKSPVGR